MAGKICTGEVSNNAFLLKETRAYCEGALARTLSTTPTNPHASGSQAADAWDRGVSDKAGDTVEACCAPMGAAATP